jgi:NADH:ubiquinone oxidoreductase subunit 4 (subunit M)
MEAFSDLTWNEMLTFFIIMLIILVVGIYPQAIIDFVGPSLDLTIESVKGTKVIVQ